MNASRTTLALTCDWDLTNRMAVAVTFLPGPITPTTAVAMSTPARNPVLSR